MVQAQCPVRQRLDQANRRQPAQRGVSLGLRVHVVGVEVGSAQQQASRDRDWRTPRGAVQQSQRQRIGRVGCVQSLIAQAERCQDARRMAGRQAFVEQRVQRGVIDARRP